MTTTRTTKSAAFERALAAEPALVHLDAMVTAFEKLAPSKRSGIPMCYACLWDAILKPLTAPLLGWERGYPLVQATDEPRPVYVNFAEMLTAAPPAQATTATEEWLRSSQAWDAVTGVWLRRLEAVDPAKGHGIGR